MNTTLTTVLFAMLLALPAMVGAQQGTLQQPAPQQDVLLRPAPLPPADPLNSNAPVQPKRANMVRYVLLMPNDKSSERVKPSERNPYGKSDEESRKTAFKGSNEENVIRDQLLKLRASGASFEKEDTRIMLGDMILRLGQIVPQVLPNQTLTLKVQNIRTDSIELQWMERKNSGLPPRILTLPVNLRPSVHYKLQGQAGAKASQTMMGEHRGSLNELAEPAELNPPSKSIIGATSGSDEPPARVTKEPTLPAVLATKGADAPPLTPVNLETVSRFIPKKPGPDGAPASLDPNPDVEVR